MAESFNKVGSNVTNDQSTLDKIECVLLIRFGF